MLTATELENFHRFAERGLSNGGFESMEDCLLRWRERRETIADIEESLADFAAGRFRSLEEVDADIRARYGFGPAQ